MLDTFSNEKDANFKKIVYDFFNLLKHEKSQFYFVISFPSNN